ncbi:MAG TPA: cysteine--tRNA ligase [Bradyrhizobium sp.]|nr:cysteine--tRNA ligase [Bradyrhizobium sp.]
MDLRLYDTLTREKRAFVPLDPANVRMYVCGPTVYDFAHIGNARPVIVFDVLFRLLRHLYGADHVTYVRNITDVDDKINARAAERRIPIRELTEDTYRNFKEDVAALGCLPPTVEPRATEHIPEMCTLIEKLVRDGFAYVAEDHVLFSPQAMNAANSVLPRYGALANRSLDEMIAGARVDVAPYKRDATDFVLWKPAKPGEPSWPSPCRIAVQGRPGWHIECSAMAWKHLGEQFDIHGGGIDLVFPHHENEIAQTCCAFHESRMANVWMHNGFLQVEGDKMSKSEGNFVTIREVLDGARGLPRLGDTIRTAMMMTHYSQPINWTEEKLATAGAMMHRFRNVGQVGLGLDGESDISQIPEIARGTASNGLIDCLADDLNTPAAFSHLFSLAKAADKRDKHLRELSRQLLSDCLFLGIDPFRSIRETDRAYRAHRQINPAAVEELIVTRARARSNKDFTKSDEIRVELEKMGIVLKDGKDADGKPVTTWEIAR